MCTPRPAGDSAGARTGDTGNAHLARILRAGVRLREGVEPSVVAAGIDAGRDVVPTVADHSPDGLVVDLECLDTVHEYEGVLRDIAAAAGRGNELTTVECAYDEGDSTCSVRYTFAGATRQAEPDWFGDYADGMFLASAAEEFAPLDRQPVITLGDALVVLYVPLEAFAWIDEFAQRPTG